MIMRRDGAPHGVLFLDVEGELIAGLDAYMDAALVVRFEGAH